MDRDGGKALVGKGGREGKALGGKGRGRGRALDRGGGGGGDVGGNAAKRGLRRWR